MPKSLDIIDPKKEIRKEPEEPILEHEDKSTGGVFYLVIGIIAIIIASLAAVYVFYFDNNNNEQQNENAALISKTPVESVTITPEESVTPSITPSAKISQVASEVFEYSGEVIRIVNGNGISGEASRIKNLLQGSGYEISSVGNASRSYSESIIYYKTGQGELANALKDDLANEYSATTKNADNIVGSYDAVVVLGSK